MEIGNFPRDVPGRRPRVLSPRADGPVKWAALPRAWWSGDLEAAGGAALLGVTFGCADGRVCPWAVSGWGGPPATLEPSGPDLAVPRLLPHGSDSPASLGQGCPSEHWTGQESVGGCREPGARASLGVAAAERNPSGPGRQPVRGRPGVGGSQGRLV